MAEFDPNDFEEFKKKFYGDDQAQRQQQAQQLEERTSNIPMAQFAASMGSALAGKGPEQAADYFGKQRAQDKADIEGQSQSTRDIVNQYLKKKYYDQAAQDQNADRDLKRSMMNLSLRDKAEARTDKLAQREKERTLPISQAESLGDANASAVALQDALKSFKANADIAGPFQGKISSLAAMGEIGETGRRAKALDAQLKTNAQTIGKYLEGGKMTDSDIERYKQMLPSINDSEEIAEKKTALLQNMLASKQQNQLKTFSQAGYNVGNISGQQAGANPNLPVKQQPQGKPKQIIQNGHTYILDEATGEYK